MGETLQPVTPRFNRSVRVECREDRLTDEPGAVLLREILEASGIVGWLGARLKDPRRQADALTVTTVINESLSTHVRERPE